MRAEEAALRADLDGYAEGKIDRVFASKVVSKLTAKISEVQRRIEAALTPPALVGLLSGAPDEDVRTRRNRAPISARRRRAAVVRLHCGQQGSP